MKEEKSVLAVDYKERIIWLDGEITQKMASRFSKIISKLNRLKVAPIVLYIRGPGGDSWSTFSMISDIQNSSSPVGCVAHDYVASGCFTLTQACIWRAALPRTKLVFHSAVGVFYASKEDVELTQKELSDWLEILRSIDFIQFFWFSMRGRPTQKIQKMLRSDKVLSLPRAERFKLMDAHFKKTDFLIDRRKIKEVLKKQKKI